MLTSYLVRCPHVGCKWFGSLLPHRDPEAWRFATPTKSNVTFHCPTCGHEWQARVVGDDVENVPPKEEAVYTV